MKDFKDKIISFSLYNHPSKAGDLTYYIGAEKNLKLNNRFLPDWKTVIYYHKDRIDEEWVPKLADLGACMIEVSENERLKGELSTMQDMMWRLLSIYEENVCIIRDLDSRMTQREANYINDWLNSECKYFIIRDHPWHASVPGGLFGIKGADKKLEDHISDFLKNNELVWGSDQEMLALYRENNIDDKDLYYCGYDDQKNYIPRDDKGFFIGVQVDENDKITKENSILALEMLEEMNL